MINSHISFDRASLPLGKDKNSSANIFVAAGLMSGTSMDGIDACLLLTDGESQIKEVASVSVAYDPAFKSSLKSCERVVKDNEGDLGKARKQFDRNHKTMSFDNIVEQSTAYHVQLIGKLIEQSGYKATDIDLIGYHGQTLFHRPKKGITIQIGDGQKLADETAIAVVYDFRSNDVKHGGQGAPFAPLYHQALAAQSNLAPVVIANFGGISNITAIGSTDNELYAYDCGPGNALIDRFVQLKTGNAMDSDGLYGMKGEINATVLEELKSKALLLKDGSNYLDIKPPKSLDVNDQVLIPTLNNLSLEDGCATLEAFTAVCIVESLHFLPFAVPKDWVLAGGGAKNPVITNALKQRLKQKLGEEVQVKLASEVGWDGQALEAQIFAYLAVRSVRRLPLSLPGTTGVNKPVSGGKLAFPKGNVKNASQTMQKLFS